MRIDCFCLTRFEFNQDNGILPVFIDNKGPTQPGLVSYLLNDVSCIYIELLVCSYNLTKINIILQPNRQKADVLIGIFGISAGRNKLMDCPFPLFIDPLALLIPEPTLKERSNFFTAVWLPFQSEVA
jgi:hypothetical protein